MVSFYEQMQRSKERVRAIVLPAMAAGNTVSVNHIIYDLEVNGYLHSEKGIIQYLKRMADIEGFKFDGEQISGY